jgi:hypothetical protein
MLVDALPNPGDGVREAWLDGSGATDSRTSGESDMRQCARVCALDHDMWSVFMFTCRRW